MIQLFRGSAKADLVSLEEKADDLDSQPFLGFGTSRGDSFSDVDGSSLPSHSPLSSNSPRFSDIEDRRTPSPSQFTGARGLLIGVLLGALVASFATPRIPNLLPTSSSPQKYASNEWFVQESEDVRAWEAADPYHQPGFIERDYIGYGARWIPYVRDDLIEGEEHRDTRLAIPPEYASFLDSTTRATDPELSFARNRTILMVGESLDRGNAEAFCKQHDGTVELVHEFHLLYACRMPDIGLTLAVWFNTGMSEASDDWFAPKDTKPGNFEARLEQKFLPNLPVIGQPDLVILASHFWDLIYFQQKEQIRRVDLGIKNGPLLHITQADLAWQRRRLTTFVNTFRQTFPSAQLMFRIGSRWRNSNTGFGESNIGVFKLNESTRALMRALKVRVLNWADLLEGEGEESYMDGQHYKVGKPGWLFTSMALHYLKEHVDTIDAGRGSGGTR
ncbi:hypothetical protein T439DRAFT_345994 [Meredithblackwellia eburnea MCA 4105]